MGFRELDIKAEYRTFDNDIVNEFYLPTLSKAITYKRAVGFFSSSVLIDISRGICSLAKRGGKIKLIVSPKLDEKDIEAIDRGYRSRDDVVNEALLREIKEPKNNLEEERYSLLAHLIERKVMDIKVAITHKDLHTGMYHEKLGIMCDEANDKIAFAGSMNETMTALSINYECIDVFCSWNEGNRVEIKEKAFDNLWNNKQSNLCVLDFPNICIDKLKKYQREKCDLELDDKEFSIEANKNNEPKMPGFIKLYDYQKEAINNWSKQNYKGIFDMATGTGKTFTALGAICKLSNMLNNELFVIIVCPYTHLVMQWLEDVEKFNIKPIVAFSGGPNKYWKKELELSVTNMNLGQRKFSCLLTTNQTFGSIYVQEQINRCKSEILLVADEVHNLGANVLQKSLNTKIIYRLGLSATLERHRDIVGTQQLYKYFGEKCIEYSLEQAIEAGYLTKYYYYPILTALDNDELNLYRDLSKKLAKCYKVDSKGNKVLNKAGELIALQRARVVSSAKQKVYKLMDILKECKDESHLLIYCGDSRIIEGDETTDKQIDIVCRMLIEKLGIRCARFTYTETAQEREVIKKEYEEGGYLQALVAIRCLDEGVNIPKIKKAFILASSTNPKEYIQRRGRVLRRAEGKEYAYIYDFITLPRSLEMAEHMDDEEKQQDISLIKKEMIRLQEFARLSENYYESHKVIKKISAVYDIDEGSNDEDGGEQF